MSDGAYVRMFVLDQDCHDSVYLAKTPTGAVELLRC
jgi:hypothetical protein